MIAPSFPDLLGLCERAKAVASRDTAAYKEYDPETRGPLHGHCGPMSYTVQRIYGGEIMSGRVWGERHLWNKLPDGSQVDLTASQFNLKIWQAPPRGRVVPPRKEVNPRYILFWDRLTEQENA